jgi:elongation factor G
MSVRAASIRNVALVGHGDSGKTTFLEAALHKCGAIQRRGSIAEKNTVGDYEPEERERGHSMDVAAAHFKWRDVEVQVVDCPGYPDFAGVATAGLWACDTALVFVNAATGVSVNTRRMWKAAGDMGKARVVVVSKMDHENADPERALSQIVASLGDRCRPFNLPVGKGAAFKGVVPCFGKSAAAPMPTLCGDADSARSSLLEAVVEVDDALLEKYLGGETLSEEALAGAMRSAVAKSRVVPVLFVSSVHGEGLAQLLDFIAAFAPSAQRPTGVAAIDEAGGSVEFDADGPFAASVFKVTSDVHVGKVSFLRVWSGKLPADGVAWCSASGQNVKLVHPTRPQGKELQNVAGVEAGDVFCVTKVEDLKLGSTVSDPARKVQATAPEFPVPMVHFAVESKAKGDEHKVAAAMSKILDEDPSFKSGRSRDTHELIISGLSSLHLELLLKRMTGRYKVDMTHRLPTVPLKETVLGLGEGHHRHKKQTGGRGQFGEVYLRVRPTPRGSGFVFEDQTVGGSIPSNFIPAVEKGVREQMEKGVIAGYPVVDVRVEPYDGKSHPVDSSEAAFKIAGARAFRDAVTKAKHALLEPVMDLEIEVPSGHLGDVTGDLNTRRGRIVGMDQHGDNQVIRAQAPLSEVQTYSTDLRSMTSGEGSFSMAFNRLDVVPFAVAQKHVEKFEKSRHPDED